MNIIEYLEKKRQKYNFSTENTQYYYNYIKNLSKFNKMVSFKTHFIIELLLIDISVQTKNKPLQIKLKKLKRIIGNENRDDLHFKYAQIMFSYKRKDYKKAYELIKTIKPKMILYDSFLTDLKFMELTCCKELNTEVEDNIITIPWHGINLVFESEYEKELFQNGFPLKGNSYERSVNYKVNKINLLFKKTNKKVKNFLASFDNKGLKNSINKSFGWKDINNAVNILKEFLDQNLGLTKEFMEFYRTISNIYAEIQNYLMVRNVEIENINYAIVSESENVENLLEKLGKNNVINFNEFQLSLRSKINEIIKNQKYVIPNVPVFYDLAYDYINEVSDNSIEGLSEKLENELATLSVSRT
ncbi:hypothetical protein CDIK_0060 [Cucumispora dikerogammari]|nr:hypothetical protein CDIK_0060 [Cucumispora dikerogammari]